MTDQNRPIPEEQAATNTAAIEPNGSTGNTSQQGVDITSPVAAPKSSTTLSTTIPAEYKVSSYDEMIPLLEKHMAEFKPLSQETLEKLRRRQKAEGIMSGISDAVRSVANLVAAHNYAPNMYDATDGMSARAKARFEREKAERQADADKYFNYALTIGRLKDADKERGLRAWQTEQALAHQERAYADSRRDRAEDVAFRNKDFDERVRQRNEDFERQGEWHKEEAERWMRQFGESVRQFNANVRIRANAAAQQIARGMAEGRVTFSLGSGNGTVSLSRDRLNAQTISTIFNTLPDTVRASVGEPVVNNGRIVYNGRDVLRKAPTTDAMLMAIGAFVDSVPETQRAIRRIAGLELGNRPAGY